MQTVSLEEKTIYGLSTRTNNRDELNPKKGKIGKLHHNFDANVTVNYQEGARVYALYYDFASDMHGDYSVLAGADAVVSSKVDLEEVTIPAGTYMVFKGHGKVPAVVFETWQKVWSYFEDEREAARRAYSVDFEFYAGAEDIEIYISLKD